MAQSIEGPEAIVQQQLIAYNGHDVEGFVSTYAADAELFLHPDKLVARGSDQIRARYASRFSDNKPKATILKRIVLGKYVIDEEEITATSEGLPKTMRAVAMYEVENEKIQRAWFIS
jgi:hypothetical protein